MEIVPVINCDDFNCVKDKLAILDGILSGEKRRVHMDISDGQYAVKPEWNDPDSLKSFIAEKNYEFSLSVHFMVRKPSAEIEKWSPLIERAVVPLDCDESMEYLSGICREKNIIPCLSIPEGKGVEETLRYANIFSEFQILAVLPGPSGQNMSEGAIEKIKELKAALSSAIIEVDGGVNPATIAAIKAAGADVALSGSYIFNSADPKSAYLELKGS